MEIRLAHPNEVGAIMTIMEEAKAFMASYGSDQWQNGYPNSDVIIEDIIEGRGHVLLLDNEVVAYVARLKGPEAAYEAIYDGDWEETVSPYVTFHRLAVAAAHRGQDLASTLLEGLMEADDTMDFRCDTHPANEPMLRLFARLGFVYRGKVMLEGERLAYQLVFATKKQAQIDYIPEGGD